MPVAASRLSPRGERPCSVVICRGCCCGNPAKDPGTDHTGQLLRLREAEADSAGRLRVRVSDCLGPCGKANVLVVTPSSEGRRRGGRPVWLGWVNGAEVTEEVLEWVAAGGPGVVEPPVTLDLHEVPPGDPARPGPRRGRRG
ncbi:(2Fe-2S) ferredoxin domain-containing protein [Streptomyces alkaliphilus]|uniref:(2Fe-2S) ferredoxin domain-containing protein n=1 Tax=Streptomyces alkaliphilus TaxID=1472722 RepID=A0A7W3TEW4_9ACTN|nr:(2Fe-2S) ferredoxin domain-containing protein [Streptomyces alkaliphilus]MBB0245447.1 (2Fe-2S) ferredoxin domain-containing protein [Streptomyces alkaliphilus]